MPAVIRSKTTEIALDGEEGVFLLLNLEETREDGKRVYRMKGVTHAQRGVLPGLPAQLFAPFSFRSSPKAPEVEGAPIERAKGKNAVEGVASSTSVDWYGTEMDRGALDSMALQFGAGVALTPRHNGWFDPVEWDEVIGVTEEGLVKAAEVENPADPKDQGYILTIRAKLFPDEEKAIVLARRLDADQPIGLSIGGWFTDVRFISNDKDEVERIIILAVKLDHLAVTRAPANPDSMGLKLMRSMGEKALKALHIHHEPEPAPAPAASLPPTPIALSVSASPGEGKPLDIVAPPASPDHPVSERSPAPIPPPEDSMDPIALRALMGELLAPIVTRLDTLEGRSAVPAPAAAPAKPASADERMTAMEAELAAQRRVNEEQARRIADLASRPAASGRRAMVPDHAYETGSHAEGSQFRSLVQLARTEGRAVSVAAVSERHAAILTADRYSPDVKRSQCEVAIRDLVNAAISDGLIRDPSADPAWN